MILRNIIACVAIYVRDNCPSLDCETSRVSTFNEVKKNDSQLPSVGSLGNSCLLPAVPDAGIMTGQSFVTVFGDSATHHLTSNE